MHALCTQSYQRTSPFASLAPSILHTHTHTHTQWVGTRAQRCNQKHSSHTHIRIHMHHHLPRPSCHDARARLSHHTSAQHVPKHAQVLLRTITVCTFSHTPSHSLTHPPTHSLTSKGSLSQGSVDPSSTNNISLTRDDLAITDHIDRNNTNLGEGGDTRESRIAWWWSE